MGRFGKSKEMKLPNPFTFSGKISISFILFFSRLNRIYLFIVKKVVALNKQIVNVIEVKIVTLQSIIIKDSFLI